jgi:hypothetical protein
MFSSLSEDTQSFLGIHAPDLGLGDLDESVLGTSADISGSSLMMHMGSYKGERRLPVFSNLRDENPDSADGQTGEGGGKIELCS